MADELPLAGPAAKLRRRDARWIWQAGVNAVQPEYCLAEALDDLDPAFPPFKEFDRIIVVGAGKASGAMARVLESALERRGIALSRVCGHVNVPNESVTPLKAIRLHGSRPAGTNQPTEEGFAGTRAILELVSQAGPNDLLLCLFSGGGSALMPAPVDGVSLADKQLVTELLHRCGANIQEMNTIRKHLSKVKGGGLVRHFKGRRVLSFLISDVVGDPLDTIASGPTCVDPTTHADALAVLEKYHLLKPAAHVARLPTTIINYLVKGGAGQEPETLKEWPRDGGGQPIINNVIVANNQRALEAAAARAKALGYEVWNLGSYFEGETRQVAKVMAQMVQGLAEERRRCWGRPGGRSQRSEVRGQKSEARSQRSKVRSQKSEVKSQESEVGAGVGDHLALTAGYSPAPLCILSGGETTVTLSPKHGKGGRNQEFVLAMLRKLAKQLDGITILCGGTDGEDGPTDAAGAIGDAAIAAAAEARKLSKTDHLARHDAYHFFEPTGGLLKTGLTQTNVMDLRVFLIAPD